MKIVNASPELVSDALGALVEWSAARDKRLLARGPEYFKADDAFWRQSEQLAEVAERIRKEIEGR